MATGVGVIQILFAQFNLPTTKTHKMAAKTRWHRYGTKLRHCHPVYSELACQTFVKQFWWPVLYAGFFKMIRRPTSV